MSYSFFYIQCFCHSVNLMKTKLDPEGLGIILLGPFLQEFFPEQVISSTLLLQSIVCYCLFDSLNTSISITELFLITNTAFRTADQQMISCIAQQTRGFYFV